MLKPNIFFISHITSSTGMILPIPKLVKEAKRRGIKTIIDGAHAPAHIELDIKTLDPDYYIFACHKWLCFPMFHFYMLKNPCKEYSAASNELGP